MHLITTTARASEVKKFQDSITLVGLLLKYTLSFFNLVSQGLWQHKLPFLSTCCIPLRVRVEKVDGKTLVLSHRRGIRKETSDAHLCCGRTS